MTANVLNWQDGVARVVNNRGLYARLLGRFCETEKDCATRIGEALDANDGEKAAYLTHSLKGTAANLGAEALARAALDLETALKSGAGDTAALLAHLQQTLEATLHEMGNFTP